VTQLRIVASVGARRIEEGDARVDGRVQRCERAGLVAVRIGRKAHAAEGDSRIESGQQGAGH
jgi:hypothetical protein